MKLWKKCTMAGALVLAGGSLYLSPKITALKAIQQFFDEPQIVENFRNTNRFWPSKPLLASSAPKPYLENLSLSLPDQFTYNGKNFATPTFLEDSWSTGLLVVQNNILVYEEYFLGNSIGARNISWSMAKSFISALIGIAIDEGKIASIEEPVDQYAPQLATSGYRGVRIKDVLQMSSGVEFNEDYGDYYSDINRWGRDFALGNSQDAFAASLQRGVPPGTLNHYVSIDTHVLSMVLARATGRSITDYTQEKLYQPMGMEYPGYWLVDGKNVEMALGGLNLTLRDFAKLGSLYLHNGQVNGRQVVPQDWIDASLTPDANHLMPGDNFGYGFQWWIPAGDSGEFFALGVYNQYIYINRKTRTVIAKLSANPHFNDPDYAPASDQVHIALFRAIANKAAVAEQNKIVNKDFGES